VDGWRREQSAARTVGWRDRLVARTVGGANGWWRDRLAARTAGGVYGWWRERPGGVDGWRRDRLVARPAGGANGRWRERSVGETYRAMTSFFESTSRYGSDIETDLDTEAAQLHPNPDLSR
jgi:hypothetical protein